MRAPAHLLWGTGARAWSLHREQTTTRPPGLPPPPQLNRRRITLALPLDVQSYLEHFTVQGVPQDKLVYLTADSDNELGELDPAAVYIIGGIVDRNRHRHRWRRALRRFLCLHLHRYRHLEAGCTHYLVTTYGFFHNHNRRHTRPWHHCNRHA